MDRKRPRKRFTRKTLVYVLGTLAVLGAGAFWAFTAQETAARISADKLQIATVEEGQFAEIISTSGSAVPNVSVMVEATEGGRVDAIYAENGDMVQQGEPLLKLSNTVLQLDYMQRETQMVEQLNNLRNTRITLQQNQRQMEDQLLEVRKELSLSQQAFASDSQLAKRDMLAKNDFHRSVEQYTYWKKKHHLAKSRLAEDEQYRQTQLAQIDHAMALMQRNLQALRKSLEQLTVKAPISGQLNSFQPELGKTWSKGQSLGRIDHNDNFNLEAQLDQYYFNRVQNGQKAQVTIGGKTYALRISKVSPTVVSSQFSITLAFAEEAPASLKRGQQFQVQVVLSAAKEALLLPKGAFYQSTGGKWVFVLTADGFAQKREVVIGRQNTSHYEIIEGLQPGEEVITSNYESFLTHNRIKLSYE